MNKLFLLVSGILLSLLLSVACSGPQDLDSPDYSQPKSNTIAFACESAWGDENQTTWSVDHSFGMFCEQTAAVNLVLGVSATTIGEQLGLLYTKQTWNKKEGEHQFYLYSPYNESNQSTTITGLLSDVQAQSGVSTTHVEGNNLMYAAVKSLEVTTPIETSLDYAFDVLDLTITSAQSSYAGWSVKSVTLTSVDKMALTGAYSFDLTTGKATITNGLPSVTVKVANASALTSNDPFHAYAVVNLPASTLRCDIAMVLSKDEEDDIQLEGQLTLTPGSESVAVNTDILDEKVLEDGSINLSDPDGTGTPVTANCYVANIAGQSYRFSATVMGNGYTTPSVSEYTGYGLATGITPVKLAPQSAKLLWQSEKNLISEVVLKSGNIYFTLNGSASTTLIEGNAVIAVYDQKGGTGNILWSWHIWVTRADLKSTLQTYTLPGQYAEAGTTIVMDRNLGSLKAGMWGSNADNLAFGLLYQWGRKDPFPSIDDAGIGGTGTIAITRYRKTYDANNVEIDVDNAATELGGDKWLYVVGKTTPYASVSRYPMCFTVLAPSWLDEARDDLWGNPFSEVISETGHKSIYDPCPPGYRVPHRYAGTIATTDGANAKPGATWKGLYDTATIKVKGGNIFPYGGGDAEYPSTGLLFIQAGKVVPYRMGSYSGHYLSSMPAANAEGRAFRFYFDYGNTNPLDVNLRYIGASVRCMKE